MARKFVEEANTERMDPRLKPAYEALSEDLT